MSNLAEKSVTPINSLTLISNEMQQCKKRRHIDAKHFGPLRSDFENDPRSVFSALERDFFLNRLTSDSIERHVLRLKMIYDKTDHVFNRSADIDGFWRTPLTDNVGLMPKKRNQVLMIEESPSVNGEELSVLLDHDNGDKAMDFEKSKTFVTPRHPQQQHKQQQRLLRYPKQADLKRKFDQIATATTDISFDEKNPSLKSIIDSTNFWRIELDPNLDYHKRFANIIYGLPNCEPNCDDELSESIGWIWEKPEQKQL